MDEPAKSKKPLIVGLLLLIVFVAAYIFVLSAYKNESNNRAAELTADTAKAGENRIDVSGRIVTADPIKGDVVVRLEFTPHGSLASGDGGALARDLDLYVSSATGKNAYEFKKGKRMNPVEVVVEIYEGEPMDYPFDAHTAELSFFFEPAAAKSGEAGGNEAIPVAVEVKRLRARAFGRAEQMHRRLEAKAGFIQPRAPEVDFAVTPRRKRGGDGPVEEGLVIHGRRIRDSVRM